MNVLIVFESEYGNTAQVAEAVAGGIRSALGEADTVELRHVRDVEPNHLRDLDLLLVGSPTQKFSAMPTTKSFLKSIPNKSLEGVAAAAFDTRITEEEFTSHGRIVAALPKVFGYAAEPIAKRLAQKGAELIAQPEGFYVGGTEGPLLDGELERAADWGRALEAQTGRTSTP